MFYSPASPTAVFAGAETISLFVNSKAGGNSSFAYEFALKPVEQQAGVTYADDAFDVEHTSGACGFLALAEGGARVIADGVWIVASGLNPQQFSRLEIVDTAGASHDLNYTVKGPTLYDPFISIPKAAA